MWNIGLYGSLFSIAAIIVELIYEACANEKNKKELLKINETQFPDKEIDEIRKIKSDKRKAFRKKKNKREVIFKYFLLFILFISNLLLTGGTIMSNNENSTHVTTEVLERTIASVHEKHDKIKNKVKILEDAVFGPGDPGGDGPTKFQIPSQLKGLSEELQLQRRLIDINTKELEDINLTLQTILHRLDHLESPGLGDRPMRGQL